MASKAMADRGDDERVWIELEYPKGGDDELGKKRAKLASRMLDRLSPPERPGQDTFWWHPTKKQYCVTIDAAGGFLVCEDNGHWFRLSYLGRES